MRVRDQLDRAVARRARRREEQARRPREADPRQRSFDFEADDEAWREATVNEIFGPRDADQHSEAA